MSEQRNVLERLDEESSRWDLHDNEYNYVLRRNDIYAIRDAMIDAAAEIRRLQAVEAVHANLRQVHDALSRRESGLYNEIIAIAKEVGHPDPEACDLGSVLSLIRERKAVQPQSVSVTAATATNPSTSGHNDLPTEVRLRIARLCSDLDEFSVLADPLYLHREHDDLRRSGAVLITASFAKLLSVLGQVQP